MRFSVPLMLTSLLQTLYGVVDTIVAGKFVGSVGLSSVTNASFVTLMISYLAMGFSNGGNILIGQYFGNKEEANRRQASGTLFTFSMLAGVVFSVLLFVLREPIVSLLKVPAYEEACAYLAICAVGVLFTFGYNALAAILRAMGNSKQPLYFIIVATVVNIVLDVWFVAGLGWGVEGTAYATVAAQFITFVAALIFVMRNRKHYGMDRENLPINGEKLKKIMKLGIPSTAIMLTVGLSWSVVTIFINKYGMEASAAAGAVNKTREICLIFLTAMGSGASVMVAQSIGAGKFDRALETFKKTFVISVLISLVLIVIVELTAPLLMKIFVTDAATLEIAIYHMRLEALSLVFFAMFNAVNALTSGSGRMLFGLLNIIVCNIGVRVVFTVVLEYFFGLDGVYWACVIAMIPAAPIGIAYIRTNRWRRKVID